MIVEMRTYKLKPGVRARFLEIFLTRSVPAHDAIGMKILGRSFPSKTRTPSSSCAASRTSNPGNR